MIKEKRGFTLGETLIALGIIGVLAAILLPFALKAKPDTNKVMYLKAYDTITQQVQKLASNTSLFAFSSNWEDNASKDNGAQIDCERLPFLNDSKPIKSGDYTTDTNGKYSGETKFCNLFAEAMGINNPSCKADVYSFNSADFNSKFNSNKTFTTKNGMQWYVTQPTARTVDAENKKATYQKDIYVDINGNKGPNCIYNSTSCTKPDRFKFELFADGELIPADPMGKLYIEGRRSFLKKDTIAEGSVNTGVNRKAVKSLKYYKEPKVDEDKYICIETLIRMHDGSTGNSSDKKIGELIFHIYEGKNINGDDRSMITDQSKINNILDAVMPAKDFALNDLYKFKFINQETQEIDKSVSINNVQFKFLGITQKYNITDISSSPKESDWADQGKNHYKYSILYGDASTQQTYCIIGRPLRCGSEHHLGYMAVHVNRWKYSAVDALQNTEVKKILTDLCNHEPYYGATADPIGGGNFTCYRDASRDYIVNVASDQAGNRGSTNIPAEFGVSATCKDEHFAQNGLPHWWTGAMGFGGGWQ